MSKDKKYRNIAEMLFDGIIAFIAGIIKSLGGIITNFFITIKGKKWG